MLHSRRPPDVVAIRPAEPGTEVLLVHAPYPAKLRFDGLPSSLLSAAAQLVGRMVEQGRAVGLLDPGEASPSFYEELERILRSGSVRVVCISTSTAAIEEAAKVAGLSKALAPSAPLVVLGGPHEDACRLKAAEAIPSVDVSIAGDGEHVLAELVDAWLLASPADVGSVLRKLERVQHLRGRGTITSRAWGSPTSRSFDVGPTDIESFHAQCDVGRTVRFDVFPGGRAIPLTISRGCAYGRCTFCSEGAGKGRVMEHFDWIQDLAARYPTVPLYFQDSIFPSSPRVRGSLLPLLRSLNRPWGCQVYLPLVSQHFIEQLADHGCKYLYTGIESGDDAILRQVGKDALTRHVITMRLGWLRGTDLSAGVSLMFGAMTEDGALLETTRTVDATIALCRQLVNDDVPIAAFYPNIQTVLPGTTIDRSFAAHGTDLDFYSMPHTTAFSAFEDGAVGYNFVTTAPGDLTRFPLVDACTAAAQELVGIQARRTESAR